MPNLSCLKLQKVNSPKSRINLVYTILLFANHLAYGITTNILGATLVDFRYIYSASLNTISYMPIAIGLGYLIGSQASYLYRYINRQLLLIIFLFLVSLTIAFLPHYGSLSIALPILFLNGIGGAAWDSSVIIWLVDMWPTSNSPVIQGANFMYGIGTIVTPLLVAPFVYGEANVTDGKILKLQDRIDALSVPFAIVGFLQLIVPSILLALYFKNPYEKAIYQSVKVHEEDSEPLDSESINSKPQRTRIPHRRVKLYLCGLCLSCYATARIGYFNFSTALLQNLDIHLSAATSAHVLGILSTGYMVGRFMSALISFKITPDKIVSFHLTLLLCAISILFFGRDDLGWISIGTAMLGYGFSAMWAGMFAFTERHLKLSDRVCSLYSLLAGSLSLVIPLIMGQSFTTNPVIFFYLEIFFIVTCAVLFVTVRLWISCGSRSTVKYGYVK